MSSIYEKYEPVIGLEVHAQMKTKTKAFCGCPADFHAPPNSNVCPVCLGHPGVLPVLNKELIDFAIRMGLATKCSIRENTLFARKNYFYPDLSKGYQITQFETPLCYDGLVNIRLKDRSVKRIGITRIHIEEDAGKSIHDFSDNSIFQHVQQQIHLSIQDLFVFYLLLLHSYQAHIEALLFPIVNNKVDPRINLWFTSGNY